MKHIKNVASMALAALLAADALGGMAVSYGEVKRGEWNSNFSDAKAYAEANGLPMLVFWANYGCTVCAKMESAVTEADFLAWQAEKRLVMTFNIGTDTAEGEAAKAFAKVATQTISDYPFMCVYWPKSSGDAVKVNFSGKNSKMPATNGTLQQQLMSSVELYLDGYNPADIYTGGHFIPSVAADSPTSHLEVDVSNPVASVPVKLYRSTVGAYTNRLVSTFPGSDPVVADVIWTGVATQQTVAVSVPSGIAAGKASLVLQDDAGGVVETSSIWLVDAPETIVSNPLWIGERTASTLAPGEWTMDIDVAKAWAGANSSYIFVYNGGPLWCPDCWAAETNFTDKAMFKSWIVEKNLAAVEIDQPRMKQTNPTLVSDELAPNGRSGLAYKTRKGISDEAGEAVRLRNLEFTTSTWKLPSSTAWRLGNPTFLMLRPDGSIIGRTAGYETSDRTNFPNEENIVRFNELLAMADDATEEINGEPSTTPLALSRSGTGAGQTLSPVDLVDVWKITDAEKNLRLVAKVTGPVSANVTVSIVHLSGGDETVLASATGDISTGVEVAGTQLADGELFVRVRGDADTTFAISNPSETIRAYTLETSGEMDSGSVGFDDTEVFAKEIDGSVEFQVTRRGASYGTAAVTVSLDGTKTTADSSNYSFEPVTLVWADGETGSKTVTLALNVDDIGNVEYSIALALAPADGNLAELGSASAVATISDTTDPMFESTSVDMTLFRKFGAQNSYAAYNVQGFASVKKTGGRLPAGISAKFDRRTGTLAFKGTPGKAGVYAATYQIIDRRDGVSVAGPETTFTFTVLDPADYNGRALSRTAYKTLPLFVEYGGTNVFAGTADISVNVSGKLTATYKGISGTARFRGEWTGMDTETGTAFASFKASRNKSLSVALDPDGAGTVVVTDADSPFGETLTGELTPPSWSKGHGADAYVGYYTVTLPAEASALDGEFAFSEAPSGTGYLTLSIGKAAAASGKVTYKGMLANGRSVSGTGYLVESPDGKFSVLNVFDSSKTDTLAVSLKIRANAAETYMGRPDVVTAGDDALCWWGHSQAGVSFARGVGVYGAYYMVENALEGICSICEDFYETKTMDFAMGGLAPQSEMYGTAAVLPRATIIVSETAMAYVTDDGLKMKFNKRTGIISGSAPVRFSGGKTVNMKYGGVLLPGWWDCGCTEIPVVSRPFASGAAYYNDTKNGKIIKRGVCVDLVPAIAE